MVGIVISIGLFLRPPRPPRPRCPPRSPHPPDYLM
jgi:hypothetical protein